MYLDRAYERESNRYERTPEALCVAMSKATKSLDLPIVQQPTPNRLQSEKFGIWNDGD